MSLVIAAMGRCGSTMLFSTLKRKFHKAIFEKDLSPSYAEGLIIKTHDFAPKQLKNCKAIYLFGDPRNIVLSAHTKGKVDRRRHYKNMHAPFKEEFLKNDTFVIKDTLRLEDNFDSWYKKQSFPLLTLRYETLYDNRDVLKQFLGFPPMLPKPRNRTTNWEKFPKANRLYKTYAGLLKKIEAAEDAKIWMP